MEITEIRIKLMESSEDRLRAFCSITIDACFVVRDLKIIDGTSGPFVAMPSRKLSGHCHRCNHKNHLRASYCNNCGAKASNDSSYDSPQKLYADVAHPINSECREMIQNAVILEFDAELQRSREPGYRSRYDDDFEYEANRGDKTAAKKSAKGSAPPEPASGTAEHDLDASVMIDSAAGSTPQPKLQDQDQDQGQRERASSELGEDDAFGAGIF